MRITQKQYAERKGVSPQYINKLVRESKIKLVGRMVDTRQADAAIKAWARAGRVVPARRSTKKIPANRVAARPRADKHPSQPRDSATRSLTAARADRENYQAKLVKLEYEKAVGNLLPREDVLEAERRKNGNIRAGFRRLARSLAPTLSRASAPAEIEQILLEEIDLILGQLARDPLGVEELVIPELQPEELPPMAAAAEAGAP